MVAVLSTIDVRHRLAWSLRGLHYGYGCYAMLSMLHGMYGMYATDGMAGMFAMHV